jgi:hypothetical protein
MKRHEKENAEKVLRQVLVGNEIMGLTFLLPVIIIGSWTNLTDDIYIHCESNLEMLDGRDLNSITFSERNREREIEWICKLKGDPIVDVRLAAEVPHLAVQFESGRILAINGCDEMYETWQVIAGEICVVACPGNEIAVWEGSD